MSILDILRKEKILHKFVANIPKNAFKPEELVHIGTAFSWMESKEGFVFWAEVDEQYLLASPITYHQLLMAVDCPPRYKEIT